MWVFQILTVGSFDLDGFNQVLHFESLLLRLLLMCRVLVSPYPTVLECSIFSPFLLLLIQPVSLFIGSNGSHFVFSLRLPARSLSVVAKSNTTLNMDDTLSLTCLVAAGNLASLALEVTWLVDGRTAVSLGRDGVVSNGSPSVGLERLGPGEFRLVVYGVRGSDKGMYSCRVRAWVGGGGRWYQAAEKTSNPVQVLVTQISE